MPDTNLLESKEAATKEKLASYKATLTEDDKKRLIEETTALKAFQTAADTAEDLKSIPLLSIDDIDKESAVIDYQVIEGGAVTYLLHETFTNNIVYGKMLFDFSGISFADLSYVSLIAKLLTKVDTDNYSYSALSDEINIHTGGISAKASVYGVNNNPSECQTRLEVKFKCFSNKLAETVEIVEEIVNGTLYTDARRIHDIVSENRSRLAMSLMSSGHSAAMTRSMSYHNLIGKYRDLLDGIDFYRFLEAVGGQEDVEGFLGRLQEISEKIFVRNNMIVLINTEEKLMQEAKEIIENSVMSMPLRENEEDMEEALTFDSLNEGFKSSSKVQYNALTGDFVSEGYNYSGHTSVLQTIMSLDYMWTEVRIKGGAYGGFGGFRRSGVFYLGSYRDPNLMKTYEIYDQLPDYVRNLEMDDREMTKYIIGTISQLDTPMTPNMKGEKALNMFMSQMTAEDLQQERNEVLGTQVVHLKALGDVIEKVIGQNHICVIGNETIVENEKEILGEVKSLFKQ